MTYRFRATPPLTHDWKHFRYAEADGVATVTLDRPEKLNPLTVESYADLRDLPAALPHHHDGPRLVADDELDGAVSKLASTLAAGPTLALSQTKSLLTRELDMPIGSAMELDAMTQALLMTTHDHAEFHAAFNERRPPNWKGR